MCDSQLKMHRELKANQEKTVAKDIIPGKMIPASPSNIKITPAIFECLLIFSAYLFLMDSLP